MCGPDMEELPLSYEACFDILSQGHYGHDSLPLVQHLEASRHLLFRDTGLGHPFSDCLCLGIFYSTLFAVG